MIIDLSHPLVTGMPVYPGDPQVAITEVLSLERHGVSVARLELGSHSGTHLDAPAHVIPGGRSVDEIPLDWLVGQALVLRATNGDAERSEIELWDMPARLPGIVLIDTGWDRYFGSERAIDHPFLGLTLAQELWTRGARVLGLDTMSPDSSSTGATPLLPVHHFWLGNDGVIVENLVGLHRLPDRVDVTMLPLRIAGGDASPIRALVSIGKTATEDMRDTPG